MYGSSPYGTTQYGGILDAIPSPDANVDLSDLGVGGILSFQLSIVIGDINGAIVDLSTLGSGGILTVLLNEAFGSGKWFADAGELWRRVPRHSDVNFRP